MTPLLDLLVLGALVGIAFFARASFRGPRSKAEFIVLRLFAVGLGVGIGLAANRGWAVGLLGALGGFVAGWLFLDPPDRRIDD